MVDLLRRLLLLIVCLLLLPSPALAHATEGPKGRVAYIYRDRLWTYDLGTGERQPLPESGELSRPQWSASGRYLSVRMGGHDVVRAAKGAFRRPVPPAQSSLVWAPNADQFARFTERATLQVERPEGGLLRSIPIRPEEHYQPPLWSPNGRALAWVEANGEPEAFVMTAPSRVGRPRQLYAISGESGHSCLYLGQWQGSRIAPALRSPRSRLLLWAQSLCSASILADGIPLAALAAKTGELRYLPFDAVQQRLPLSSSGWVAVATGTGRISTQNKRIQLIRPDGSVTDPVSPEGQAAIQPAWAPNGRTLAWAGAPDYGPDAEWQKGLRERRIWVSSVHEPDAGPRPVTDDPAYRDEAPVWTADGAHLLFVRLDAQDLASLWLLHVPSEQVSKIADLDDAVAEDYYGWREWERLFAYSGR